ncbi:MAG: hypothetical protein V1757_03020 [Actinomycetota bacterium]
MKRPTGVTWVSVLLWIVGVVNVLAGLSWRSEFAPIWGVLEVVIGAAAIACGIGCWQLRSWARLGTMALMGLNAINLIAIWVRYSDRIIVSRAVTPLAINVIVIAYLMQPKVREAFAKPGATAP